MMPDDPQPWRTQATQQVFENRWLAIHLDEVILPTGRRYEYTRLAPRGIGVALLGFNNAGEVLLEREYRHGVGEVIWQLPGGLAAEGEDLQAAGLRELLEETGYAPSVVNGETVRYLGVVWDSPAFGPMCSHIYAAQGLELQYIIRLLVLGAVLLALSGGSCFIVSHHFKRNAQQI